MRVGIFGGGFGLYGYLPALINHLGLQVTLPQKARSGLFARPELCALDSAIDWVADEAAMLAACQAIVIAVPPAAQPAIAARCLAQPQITHVLLEKPLAADPLAAEELLHSLRQTAVNFRLGYNFRQTFWGQQLLAAEQGVQAIKWTFKAHHYSQGLSTWKRQHALGGGALRFYGIHVIALLAELGYTGVTTSTLHAGQPGEAARWQAEFTGSAMPSCYVTVASNASITAFNLRDGAGSSSHLPQPFALPEQAARQPDQLGDARVPILTKVLRDLFTSHQPVPAFYERANALWKSAEQQLITV